MSNDTKKSQKDIAAQIRLLKLQRRGIPQTGLFGDNWKGIDARIAVLERCLPKPAEVIALDQNASGVSDDEYDAYSWVLNQLTDDLVGADDSWVQKALEAEAVTLKDQRAKDEADKKAATDKVVKDAAAAVAKQKTEDEERDRNQRHGS